MSTIPKRPEPFPSPFEDGEFIRDYDGEFAHEHAVAKVAVEALNRINFSDMDISAAEETAATALRQIQDSGWKDE